MAPRNRNNKPQTKTARVCIRLSQGKESGANSMPRIFMMMHTHTKVAVKIQSSSAAADHELRTKV